MFQIVRGTLLKIFCCYTMLWILWHFTYGKRWLWIFIKLLRDFPGSPAVKTPLPMLGVWVWSMGGELWSQMPHNMAKKRIPRSLCHSQWLCFSDWILIHAANQGLHFMSKWAQQWARDHGIQWSCCVEHHLEVTSLIQHCDGLKWHNEGTRW